MADTAEIPATLRLEQHLEDGLTSVREILGNLRYGSISLIVHEGRIVQLDVTEKKRLTVS